MADQRKTARDTTVSAAARPGGQKTVKKKKHTREPVPLPLKMVLFPFLLIVSLLFGLIIGYSVVGKGPVLEVFDLHTYTHMYDLIFG
ncbi:DNA-directed RNA polymerase subunit beta [Aneurinibacillus terranovensis]|uniref:DNA-directed RNA polymerase subunit beta n=1 Tax=Aneurinibacillus terranovensis TaxID=278991 RepID=UPI0004187101|nr:DNA-directed RNA polymerase subunit beta [Aneurinibacillus terranovensis]